MKKFLLFPLLVFMTAFIVPACSDEDKEIFPPNPNDTITNDTITNDTIDDDSLHTNIPITLKFGGDLIVNGNFKKENTVCMVRGINDSKFSLDIYKVKFAENMPVEINITIPDIPFNHKDGTFSGDSIVPLIGVAPAPAYTFSKIEGCLTDSSLTFSATLTRGTFTFSGTGKRN